MENIKEQLEEVVRKHLPEKKEKVYRSDGKTELFITSNFHFNQAISQIDTALIADEVLKVMVEKIKNYKPHIGEDGLLRRKGLLDYLSPNKENVNNED